MTVTVDAFFDDATNTITYMVVEAASKSVAIIDPVLDFDLHTGRLGTAGADRLFARIAEQQLDLKYIFETHAHADHLTAGHYLRAKTSGRLAIGSMITDVQKTFAPIFEADDIAYDGSAFDLLLDDGDKLPFGDSEITVMHTPGHTSACVTYVVGDAAFVGDTLFMPDFGSARCDFPGGDAATLFRSIQKILALPGDTRIFTCHDYLPEGRNEYAWESTVAEQKRSNIHVHDGISADEFITMRETRDAKLSAPKLILPSLQVNIRAGTLPPAEKSGTTFLRLPVNAFPGYEKTSEELSARVADFQPD
ncbi:MBL-fold metallo-hydrolase superfamily, partial [hydrothermal vent metagenome]